MVVMVEKVEKMIIHQVVVRICLKIVRNRLLVDPEVEAQEPVEVLEAELCLRPIVIYL
jgi:hypothetical protein